MKGCKCGNIVCDETDSVKCIVEGLTTEQWKNTPAYMKHKIKILKEDVETVKHQRDTYSNEAFELDLQLKGQQVLQKNIEALISKVHNRRGKLEMAHTTDDVVEPPTKKFGHSGEIRFLENIEWGFDSCTNSEMSFAFVNNVATVTFVRGYCTEVVLVGMEDGNILAVATYGKDFN